MMNMAPSLSNPNQQNMQHPIFFDQSNLPFPNQMVTHMATASVPVH